jgi:hypothetical protein
MQQKTTNSVLLCLFGSMNSRSSQWPLHLCLLLSTVGNGLGNGEEISPLYGYILVHTILQYFYKVPTWSQFLDINLNYNTSCTITDLLNKKTWHVGKWLSPWLYIKKKSSHTCRENPTNSVSIHTQGPITGENDHDRSLTCVLEHVLCPPVYRGRCP